MLQEPLFQSNIIATIIRNFSFYLFNTSWFYYGLGLLTALSLIILLLRLANADREAGLFPIQAYSFSRPNRYSLAAAGFCLLCLGLYSLNIFSLDNSLFNNYDLMSVNTTFIFDKGVAASYGISRLNPIASYDLNFIYAITHNYNLINIYIIFKQILILILFYNFLNFIPSGKRLFLLGALTFLPVCFWINNIIFPEQDLLIFMLSGFLCLRRFTRNGNFLNLWLYGLFTLLAVYTKETTVVFYVGILIFALLYYVFIDKINYANLFHPWRLAKAFPFEFITFMISLSFALFYLFITNGMEENNYVIPRQLSMPELCRLYGFEITLTLVAWTVLLKKTVRKEKFFNPVFNEGLLFGATSILLFIIFVLKMNPGIPHVSYKSYYAMLCGIFSLIYIIRNLSNIKVLIAFLILVILGSAVANYRFHQKEQGIYYHQVADFVAEKIQDGKPLVLSVAPHSENHPWVYETWSSATRYYFPSADITFKYPWLENTSSLKLSMYIYQLYYDAGKFTKISPKQLAKGDFYIVKKTSSDYTKDMDTIKKFTPELVYKNKIFEVYELQ